LERLKKVEAFLLGKTANEVLFMNVTEPVIKDIPALRVISKREKGSIEVTFGKLIWELISQINKPENRREHVSINGPPMYIMHDTEFNDEEMDIEIAFPITGRITVDSEFDVKTLDAVKVVSVTHTGPYGDIGPSYNKAYDYVMQKGYNQTQQIREIYFNNPLEVPEEELLTEIQIPIEINN